jgi:hypothetical protein
MDHRTTRARKTQDRQRAISGAMACWTRDNGTCQSRKAHRAAPAIVGLLIMTSGLDLGQSSNNSRIQRRFSGRSYRCATGLRRSFGRRVRAWAFDVRPVPQAVIDDQ